MMNNKKTFGIPDDNFIRSSVPMTKEEVRAVIISKLQITEKSNILDIGAGTGSLSIQSAILAKKGTVYAVEKKEEAVRLINENIKKFCLENIKVIKKKAPVLDLNIKNIDRIILGGSGGDQDGILEWSDSVLVSGGKIVIPSITMETLKIAEEFMEKKNYNNIEITLVNISKFENTGKIKMLKASNPVFIISGEKNG